MLPGPGPVLCTIHEWQVIFKVVLHTRLVWSAIIILYCLVYIVCRGYEFVPLAFETLAQPSSSTVYFVRKLGAAIRASTGEERPRLFSGKTSALLFNSTTLPVLWDPS